MKPEPAPPRTVAVVLAAGLGTRMKSRVRRCSTSCAAGRCSGTCSRRLAPRPTSARSSSTHPRPRRSGTSFAERRRHCPPGRATRDRPMRCRAALAALPDDVGRGPRPVGRRAAPRGRPARGAARAAAPGRRGDRAGLRRRLDPARLGRVVRDDDGTVERIVEAKDATEDELEVDEINAGRVRDRRRLAAAPDRRPAARRRRPASCT